MKDIFSYNDYRQYLKDFLEAQKSLSGGLSMRKLCEKSGVSVSLLSMIINGDRILSEESLKKILPFLSFNVDEKKYFKLLVSFDNEKNELEKEKKFKKLESLLTRLGKDLKTLNHYKYLSKWYYIAIRELSMTQNFNYDPEWIQKKLRFKVSRSEVVDALDFLIKKSYIKSSLSGGEVSSSQKGYSKKGEMEHIGLRGRVYSQSLKKFHKLMLEQASSAIDTVPREERLFLGNTFSVSRARLSEAKKILEKALVEVQALNENVSESDRDSVYHMSLALFPLTKGDL